MTRSTPTLEDVRPFWPSRDAWDGIDIGELLIEVQSFALKTFDSLDTDGNGFISASELENALQKNSHNWREKNYIHFLFSNVEKIGRAFDDQDGISPCGISRNDIKGISRNDLVQYFGRM
jgi:hypothetical protein